MIDLSFSLKAYPSWEIAITPDPAAICTICHDNSIPSIPEGLDIHPRIQTLWLSHKATTDPSLLHHFPKRPHDVRVLPDAKNPCWRHLVCAIIFRNAGEVVGKPTPEAFVEHGTCNSCSHTVVFPPRLQDLIRTGLPGPHRNLFCFPYDGPGRTIDGLLVNTDDLEDAIIEAVPGQKRGAKYPELEDVMKKASRIGWQPEMNIEEVLIRHEFVIEKGEARPGVVDFIEEAILGGCIPITCGSFDTALKLLATQESLTVFEVLLNAYTYDAEVASREGDAYVNHVVQVQKRSRVTTGEFLYRIGNLAAFDRMVVHLAGKSQEAAATLFTNLLSTILPRVRAPFTEVADFLARFQRACPELWEESTRSVIPLLAYDAVQKDRWELTLFLITNIPSAFPYLSIKNKMDDILYHSRKINSYCEK
ncbi:MAG: hypothetical protein JSR76_08615 [Verrucomicrobia bacterium]|nr:hypothetical protein [Verrucomicrobiota bacterium]